MSRKYRISLTVVLSLIAVMLFAIPLGGCAKEEEEFPVWQLSSTVTASFSDNGKHGYILTVEGTGDMPEYSSKKDTPWYGKSGRVTEIVVKDGITSVSKNAFTECFYVKSAELPETVTKIGENAFAVTSKAYAKNSEAAATGANVYVYSEEEPTTAGNYWHYLNGIATVWQTTAKVTKVLFIGNSFTYYSNIPKIFENICNSVGAKVVADSVTMGSHTLEKFADATDEYGKIVDQKLNASNDYDVVVLQEQTTRPLTDYDKFVAGAKSLQQKINATQTNCQIYLYSTWGYKEAADARKITIPEMEGQIRTAYDNAAKELGVKVSYSGAAFSKVYTEHPEINLYYYADNKHPSYLGAYLSACVHAATILKADPRATDYLGSNPADSNDEVLDENTAKILREAAYSIVNG